MEYFLWHCQSKHRYINNSKPIPSWAIIWLKSNDEICLPAILSEQRAWLEIQNLHMRFVIIKVRNPLLSTVSRGPLYIIAHASGSWDWPTWLNKPWSGILIMISKLRQSTICYAGLLGRWDKWIVDQESDVQSIFFLNTYMRLRALKALYFCFCNFSEKL